jgi:hypothetical protein
MLKTNTSITELNVSQNWLSAEAAGILAEAIKDNGAMSVFTFSGDYSNKQPVTMKTSMTEADFNRKGLGASGAIMLSAFLPKCM